ncbi:MAG TPA: phosphorylase [bacterium]
MDTAAPEPFTPGTLAASVAAVTEAALASGALLPIATGVTWIEDGGVRFLVRVLTNLARKDEDRWRREKDAATGAPPVNPFLPYDPALFVAGVSPSHVAILNKFNVVERHVLVVTRRFEDQRALLTPADFEALWRCLAEYPALGFYNGGAEAGASQAHKHLQLVPLPLAAEGPPVPIDPLIARVHPGSPGQAGELPGFGFLHAFARLGGDGGGDPGARARAAWQTYRALLADVGLRAPSGGDAPEMQDGPYCLLVTREWMLVVPRSREHFRSVSINSLGYAGALLVRTEEELAILRQVGPLAALRETALPPRP